MKNYHPYDVEGDIIEEVHGDRTFILGNALYYVVDDYDSSIDSVELSHYENLGYNNVIDFTPSEAYPNILDLRWMDKKDSFVLEQNDSNCDIDTILVNINNLEGSEAAKYYGFNNVNYTIFSDGSMNTVKQSKILKDFLTINGSAINSISYVGFPKVINAVLQNYTDRLLEKNEKNKSL